MASPLYTSVDGLSLMPASEQDIGVRAPLPVQGDASYSDYGVVTDAASGTASDLVTGAAGVGQGIIDTTSAIGSAVKSAVSFGTPSNLVLIAVVLIIVWKVA